MSKKNVFVVIALVVCVIATAGGLLASNMGFKLNFQLTQPAPTGAGTGRQLLSLPYFRQTNVNTASDLILDIGPVTSTNSVQKYIKSSDTLQSYNGRMTSPTATPFALAAGEGYLVQMNSNTNYIIVGAHDPSFAIQLTGPAGVGGAGTGRQLVAPPYNITAANALQLITDIGAITSTNSVQKYIKSTDTLQSYNGRMTSPTAIPFALAPGEAYLIQMNSNVPYIASHY